MSKTNPVSIYYKDYINEEKTEEVVYKNATELLSKYEQHLKAFPNRDITFVAKETETYTNFKLGINLTVPTKTVVNIILNLNMKGSSTVSLEGSNYSVQNLYMSEGDKNRTFKDHIVKVRGSSIKLINFSLIEYLVKDDDLDFVRIYSKDFQLHNSIISGKYNNGIMLCLDFPENHIIKQCIFNNFIFKGTNGGEAIRCATSGFEKQKSNCLIESCYFEKCNGDPEVISLKCSYITVRKCIFKNNSGRLVFRHCNNCIAENCYFTLNGLRVYGDNHVFLNNQLDNGANLLLDNKPGYNQPDNTKINGLYYTKSVKEPLTDRGKNTEVKNLINELVFTEQSLYTVKKTLR